MKKILEIFFGILIVSLIFIFFCLVVSFVDEDPYYLAYSRNSRIENAYKVEYNEYKGVKSLIFYLEKYRRPLIFHGGFYDTMPRGYEPNKIIEVRFAATNEVKVREAGKQHFCLRVCDRIRDDLVYLLEEHADKIYSDGNVAVFVF